VVCWVLRGMIAWIGLEDVDVYCLEHRNFGKSHDLDLRTRSSRRVQYIRALKTTRDEWKQYCQRPTRPCCADQRNVVKLEENASLRRFLANPSRSASDVTNDRNEQQSTSRMHHIPQQHAHSPSNEPHVKPNLDPRSEQSHG
jgi:hypothetical protein